MAQLYYTLIKKGTWTIEQVPEIWRADVQHKLDVDKATV